MSLMFPRFHYSLHYPGDTTNANKQHKYPRYDNGVIKTNPRKLVHVEKKVLWNAFQRTCLREVNHKFAGIKKKNMLKPHNITRNT